MGRRAEAYAFDVGHARRVKTMCARVIEDFETIDILVNNAGVTRDGLFRKMDRGAWDEVINTNLNSVFEITQNFIEPMAARGWGRVINISSIVGHIGNFGQANYAAAKAGLIGLTKTLAREYARKGVTVNAIAPGFVRTRMLDGVPDKALQSVLDITPVGRLGDPMEIGGERPLPRLSGRRLRHRPRAGRQRRHGDVAADAAGASTRATKGRRASTTNGGPARAAKSTGSRRYSPNSGGCGSRLLSLPRVFAGGPETRVGTTPRDGRARGGHASSCCTTGARRRPPTPSRCCSATRWSTAPTSSTCSPTRASCSSTCERGFEVYLIDWGVPSDADRGLTLEHYVCGFLQRAVDVDPASDRRMTASICSATAWAGRMTTLVTALRPELVRTLTLLAAPIDFAGHDVALNLWTNPRYFDVDAVVDAYGNCPAWFLQTLLPVHEPGRGTSSKRTSRSTSRWTTGEASTNHFALESWVNDNIPVAGETFREFVKKLYQRNQLVRGELPLGGRRVDLGADHLPALALDRQERSPGRAGVDGRNPPPRRDDRHRIDGDRRRPRRPGGQRASAHKSFWPAATRWLGRPFDDRCPGGRERQTRAPARHDHSGASAMGIRISGIGGYVPRRR